MSIRDKVRHLTEHATWHPRTPESPQTPTGEGDATLNLARYNYLLRVASPEVVKQLHQEAFAALDLEQRERVFLRLRHDLAENQQPASSQPVDLARAAVAAHEGDHGYLVRMLRRPGQGVTEGHFVPEGRGRSGGLLFAGSVLGHVAATAVGSAAAAESLIGFDTSPEAAQADTSVFVHPSGPMGHGLWQAGAGGVAGGGSGGDGGGAGAGGI